MSGINAFTPGITVVLSATTTTSRVALLPSTSYYRGGSLRVGSISTNANCFIKFGDSTVVATTSDMVIPLGTVEIFTVPVNATHVAAITSAGTAILNLTLGEGI